jgi:hypothetical protein
VECFLFKVITLWHLNQIRNNTVIYALDSHKNMYPCKYVDWHENRKER